MKAAYFAQYWGQPVQTYKLSYSWKRNVEVNGSSQGFITLKPLSSITDEDAIEVAKIANSPSFAIPKEWKVELDSEYGFVTVKSDKSNHSFDLDIKDGHLQMYDGDYKSDMFFNHYRVCDFLRSKGYALPYRQYSVDDLITKGWLKLTNK